MTQRFTDRVWKVNLLFSELFLTYAKDPAQFRREAVEKIEREGIKVIIVDEIQRVPLLLNELHALIETYPACQFVLTGSSARKLKRGAANLLAGRALERRLFPLLYQEMAALFSLDEVLMFGSLPPVVTMSPADRRDFLQAYVHTYLQEEIQNEGLVRNLGGFSRFLDIAAAQSGEAVNFTAIGRDCALPTRTVQSYYEILEDTLVGVRLAPWRRSVRKRLSAQPRFYLFDLGVINALNRRLTGGIDPVLRGRLFEHFIVLETHRLLHYRRSEAALYCWRTNHGAEVDLVIEKHGRLVAAFEIKSASHVAGADLSGLRALREDHPEIPCSVICTAERGYQINDMRVLPWPTYLQELAEIL